MNELHDYALRYSSELPTSPQRLIEILVPERLRSHLRRLPTDVEASWYSDVPGCLGAVHRAEVLLVDFGVPKQRNTNQRLTDINAILEAGAMLRWVAALTTGVENWPLNAFGQRHVLLTHSSGMNTIPISEYVVMTLLAGLKGLPDLIRAQDRREWLPKPPALGELHGKRALIYGYGRIGRAIGERLQPFGVNVVGVRRSSTNEAGVISSVGWESMLPETDILILSVPLTTATRHLIGAGQLAALPQGAWVINIARGGLIDERALIYSLASGHLGGAHLDVTDHEPLQSQSELWSLPNVMITPHTSWASSRAMERGAEIFLENLSRYSRGDRLRNLVDLEQGY